MNRPYESFQTPDNIELRNYEYQHGIADSTVDDRTMIGRTEQSERLLSWLKANHREPGTGLRHGCYLVTGNRGAGKTTFVNRVLHQYRRWLLWLHGDEHRQVHEVRLNLGAGRLTPTNVLQFMAEGLYNQARSPLFEPIFRSFMLWLGALLCLLLGTDLFARAAARTVEWNKQRETTAIARDVSVVLSSSNAPVGLLSGSPASGPGASQPLMTSMVSQSDALIRLEGKLRKDPHGHANRRIGSDGTVVFHTLCEAIDAIIRTNSFTSWSIQWPTNTTRLRSPEVFSQDEFRTGCATALKAALLTTAMTNGWACERTSRQTDVCRNQVAVTTSTNAPSTNGVASASHPLLWGVLGAYATNESAAGKLEPCTPVTWVDTLTTLPILLLILTTMQYMVHRVQRPIIRHIEGRFADNIILIITSGIFTCLLANFVPVLLPDQKLLHYTAIVPGSSHFVKILLRYGRSYRSQTPPSHWTPTHYITDAALAAMSLLFGVYACFGTERAVAYSAVLIAVVSLSQLLWVYWVFLNQQPDPARAGATYDSDAGYCVRTILHLVATTLAAAIFVLNLLPSTLCMVAALGLLLILTFFQARGSFNIPSPFKSAYRALLDFRRRSTTNFAYCCGYLKVIVIFALCAICAAVAASVSRGTHMATFMSLVIGVLLDSASWLEKLFPLVVVLSLSDGYVAGHAMIEPDFGPANRAARKTRPDRDTEGRANLLRRSGSVFSVTSLLEGLSNHLRFQRKIRSIRRRLRSHHEHEFGSAGHAPVLPSLAMRWSDLPYTYQTLESDLIDAILLHNRAYPHRDLIIVFDELDKVTLDNSQREPAGPLAFPSLRPPEIDAVHVLLSEMKNIISSAEARFVFIAGRELRDHWLMDMSEKLSLVSSAFASPIDIPSLLTDQVGHTDKSVHALTGTLVARRVMSAKELSHSWSGYLNALEAYLLTPALRRQLGEADRAGRAVALASGKTARLGTQLELVHAHYLELPSYFSAAYALTQRIGPHRDAVRATISAGTAIRQIWHLRDVIHFLTFRSAGLPNALNVYFDRFVTDEAEHRKSSLVLDGRSAPQVQLARYFTSLLTPIMNNAAEHYSDQAILTGMYFASYLCRFSGTAFNWSLVEEMRDVVSPYHDPNVRFMLRSVFTRFEDACMAPILNGVYTHRFVEWLRSEIAYSASRSAPEAASYSFGFEQGAEVRRYIMDQIRAVRKHHAAGPSSPETDTTTRGLYSLYQSLGELYEIEEMFHLALDCYKLALREIKHISRIQCAPRDSGKQVLSPHVHSWMFMHVRIRLRIGHVYELTGEYERALSSYSEAIGFSEWTLEHIARHIKHDIEGAQISVLPRFITSRVLVQPFMCLACLMLKLDSASRGPNRMRAIDSLIDRIQQMIEEIEHRKEPGVYIAPISNVLVELRVLLADTLTRGGDIFLVAGASQVENAGTYFKNAIEVLLKIGIPFAIGSDMPSQAVAAFAMALSSFGDTKMARAGSFGPTALDGLLRIPPPRQLDDGTSFAETWPASEAWRSAAALLLRLGNNAGAAFQWIKMLGTAQRVILLSDGVRAEEWASHVSSWEKAGTTAIDTVTGTLEEMDALATSEDRLLMAIAEAGVRDVRAAREADQAEPPVGDESVDSAKTGFEHEPISAREATLRLLYCKSTLLWRNAMPEWDDRVLSMPDSVFTAQLKEVRRRVDNLTNYYRYSHFPIRLKAMFMEIKGDLVSIQAVTRMKRLRDAADGKRPRLTQSIAMHALLAYRYYLWSTDIRMALGPSFNATHFSVAFLRDKAAHALRIFEVVGGDEAESTRVLSLFARADHFPATEDVIRNARSLTQWNLAVSSYTKSIEARDMGPEFTRLFRDYSYLMDDFHGDETHYPLSYERMMVDFSDSRRRRRWGNVRQLFDFPI